MESKISMVLSLTVLLIIIAHCGVQADHTSPSCKRKLPCGPSKFLFYLHNTVYDKSVDNRQYFNSIYGLPPNISFPNPFGFGIMNIFEDPLTVGPSNTSKSLGKAQGFYVLDSFKEYTLFHIFTANITEGDFKGTVDIFGQVREADAVRYLTVVGGTGAFLGARGLASSTRIEIDHTPPAKWTLSFDLDLYY
ncbi:hypothetical protein KP509_38G032000 [Ceratopteris richardii]|uniref:Dirigent protein n=1 Tax=Ceratopteris richardii TaxID=49495 RepID=A0A8T2Q2R5_CERRI|nr:hypothetical protein KP509_38G032000 [Ceratopteris richardii]